MPDTKVKDAKESPKKQEKPKEPEKGLFKLSDKNALTDALKKDQAKKEESKKDAPAAGSLFGAPLGGGTGKGGGFDFNKNKDSFLNSGNK